jgi:biopolymer transport protein ExbB
MLSVLLLLVWTGQAYAWWNEGWKYRKKIDLDTSASGASIASAVEGVPLLIRLHSGNFDFTQAREDGADLRFVAGDDATVLKYQIENYDSLEEMAIIWVKAPRITAGAGNSLYFYYGNPDAANGSDPAGCFDNGQALVLHFAESEGMPADSTGFHNNASAFTGGQGLPSIIGKGISLNGATDMLTVPASPSLETNQGFTFSSWVRITRPQTGAPLLTRRDKAGMLQVGIEGTAIFAEFTSNDTRKFSSYPVGDLVLDQWNHVAVSGVAGGELHILINGAAVATTTTTLPNELPKLTTDLVIGGASANGAFSGELDEVRFSTTALSTDRLTLSARSQAPEAAITLFGAAETGGGAEAVPLIYLGTIAKNITVDGWVIITILVLIAALSWMVVLGKSYIFYNMEKGNRIFRLTFDRQTRQAPIIDCDGDNFGPSPLYRIYQAGYDILTRPDDHGCGRENGRKFHADCMKNFMFAVEKSYLHETKRLNSWLALLTIAISGGPFLGLLGTVWGVMNTFAAMAEAGEANIMAIAPGIASALATTVFGLIVAIPALFGYNYLATKIKQITSDLNIFLDEYAIKVELHKGETEK